MTAKEKIEYMIQCLELAKSEIAYAEEYGKARKKDPDFYCWNHMGYSARTPNGTIIRENLKMVGRIANITAKEVTLSPYCNKIFKEEVE